MPTETAGTNIRNHHQTMDPPSSGRSTTKGRQQKKKKPYKKRGKRGKYRKKGTAAVPKIRKPRRSRRSRPPPKQTQQQQLASLTQERKTLELAIAQVIKGQADRHEEKMKRQAQMSRPRGLRSLEQEQALTRRRRDHDTLADLVDQTELYEIMALQADLRQVIAEQTALKKTLGLLTPEQQQQQQRLLEQQGLIQPEAMVGVTTTTTTTTVPYDVGELIDEVLAENRSLETPVNQAGSMKIVLFEPFTAYTSIDRLPALPEEEEDEDIGGSVTPPVSYQGLDFDSWYDSILDTTEPDEDQSSQATVVYQGLYWDDWHGSIWDATEPYDPIGGLIHGFRKIRLKEAGRRINRDK